MHGWIYVLSHPAWQKIGGTGAVKIGKTGVDPAKRGLQIASASGLIRRPTVEFCCWVADRGAVERAVHQQLGHYRVAARRELFAVPVATARAVIEASTTARPIKLRTRSRKRYRQDSRRMLLGILAASAVLLSLGWWL